MVKILRKVIGDAGNLKVILYKRDARFYVVVFNYYHKPEPNVTKKWFFKRSRADKYFDKIVKEF